MATIQVVIEQELLEQLDQEIAGVPKARSAFIRKAIRAELKRTEIARLEEQHRQSYADMPESEQELAENSAWEQIQDPGESWEPARG